MHLKLVILSKNEKIFWNCPVQSDENKPISEKIYSVKKRNKKNPQKTATKKPETNS